MFKGATIRLMADLTTQWWKIEDNRMITQHAEKRFSIQKNTPQKGR